MTRRTTIAVIALLFCGIAVFRLLRPRPVSRGVLRPVSISQSSAPGSQTLAERAYLGFDRNLYPGDDAMAILRNTFSFTGYWLSPPPGEKETTWRGKRDFLRSNGFGFLILYRGREERELKTESQARTMGALDAQNAIASAKREGFSASAILFLDIEGGGRLSPAYHAYLGAWSETLSHSGYKPGVYCSGISVAESPGLTITTTAAIHDDPNLRDLAIWAFNDVCPPSPGCSTAENAPPPYQSGINFAAVWQFAQSPRRKERTALCAANYSADGNCYAPFDTAHAWFLDLNAALSADPSHGRE
jgi:glycoside hydrolase-like protein